MAGKNPLTFSFLFCFWFSFLRQWIQSNWKSSLPRVTLLMIDLIKLCLLKVAVGKGCKAAIFLSISCNSKGYLFTQFGNRHVLQHSWKWSKLPLLCHVLCCLKIQFRNKAKHLQGSCSRQDLGSGEVLHINECLPCTNVRAVGVSITIVTRHCWFLQWAFCFLSFVLSNKICL